MSSNSSPPAHRSPAKGRVSGDGSSIRDELRPLLGSAALFFCLLLAYYVLRPVREVCGIESGPV